MESVQSQLRSICGGLVEFEELSSVSLWAGYGWLKRLKVKTPESRILVHKFINPASSNGDRSTVGHRRKVASYKNEATFYARLAPILKAQHLPLPTCLHSGDLSDRLEVTSIFMEDLREEYPIENIHSLNKDQVTAAVKWLAKLHALCWHRDYEEKMGYLDTRTEEYDTINEKEWGSLKRVAPVLSDRLKKHGSGAGWTVIHGDYKATNLMYGESRKDVYGCNFSKCAGLDYQYTGGGYGARDLVMLIVCGCRLDRDDMEAGLDAETDVLLLYYQCLCEELSTREDGEELLQEYSMSLLRGQYELALMDLVRFLAGWGMWGNSNYACQRVKALLHALDRGEILSEEQYRNALERQYPLSFLY